MYQRHPIRCSSSCLVHHYLVKLTIIQLFYFLYRYGALGWNWFHSESLISPPLSMALGFIAEQSRAELQLSSLPSCSSARESKGSNTQRCRMESEIHLLLDIWLQLGSPRPFLSSACRPLSSATSWCIKDSTVTALVQILHILSAFFLLSHTFFTFLPSPQNYSHSQRGHTTTQFCILYSGFYSLWVFLIAPVIVVHVYTGFTSASFIFSSQLWAFASPLPAVVCDFFTSSCCTNS